MSTSGETGGIRSTQGADIGSNQVPQTEERGNLGGREVELIGGSGEGVAQNVARLGQGLIANQGENQRENQGDNDDLPPINQLPTLQRGEGYYDASTSRSANQQNQSPR
jgi:hypothetical protein